MSEINRKYIHKKAGRWSVCIMHSHYDKHYCGTYETIEEAAQVRDAKLMELDGNLSRLDKFCQSRGSLPDETLVEIKRLMEQGYGRSTIKTMLNISEGAADYYTRKLRYETMEKDDTLMKLLYTNEFINSGVVLN